MGKFYITDGQHLFGTGECQDGMESSQGFGSFTSHAGVPPPFLTERPTPPLRYDALREREYPSIRNQLDAIWKLIGPTSPANSDARAMYDIIVDIKNKYPKA